MNDGTTDEGAMRTVFGSARSLEPSDRLVTNVVREVGQRRGQLARRWIAVGLVALAVPAAASALTPIRDALSDAAGTFSGYFDDGGSGPDAAASPGRPLRSSDTPPAWLTADARTGQRLLATAAGYDLFITREPSGDFGFALGDTFGISDSARGWEHQFAGNDAVILGPGTSVDSDGILPLYGVTSGDVASVEIRYESGPPSDADADDGGFVALAEVARKPVELLALDRDGTTLQELDLTYISMFR